MSKTTKILLHDLTWAGAIVKSVVTGVIHGLYTPLVVFWVFRKLNGKFDEKTEGLEAAVVICRAAFQFVTAVILTMYGLFIWGLFPLFVILLVTNAVDYVVDVRRRVTSMGKLATILSLALVLSFGLTATVMADDRSDYSFDYSLWGSSQRRIVAELKKQEGWTHEVWDGKYVHAVSHQSEGNWESKTFRFNDKDQLFHYEYIVFGTSEQLGEIIERLVYEKGLPQLQIRSRLKRFVGEMPNSHTFIWDRRDGVYVSFHYIEFGRVYIKYVSKEFAPPTGKYPVLEPLG